ncbi:uncharacterized protein [Dysidea avara]|uniref:uncharacterized protein n=1 Tax=Dysidea avara TaxID=196820 RepID=UPI00332DB382
MLYMQEQLAEYRRNPSAPPHLRKHPQPRIMWLKGSGLKSMEGIQVSQVGMKKFVAAWNEHWIRGRGIPNVLMAQNNQTKPIDNSVVPAANEAGRQYEENGGTVQ